MAWFKLLADSHSAVFEWKNQRDIDNCRNSPKAWVECDAHGTPLNATSGANPTVQHDSSCAALCGSGCTCGAWINTSAPALNGGSVRWMPITSGGHLMAWLCCCGEVCPSQHCWKCDESATIAPVPKQNIDKKEDELRRRILPEFRHENACRWRYPQPLPKGSPRPAARLEDGPNLDKAKAAIRKWCGYGMKEWPQCRFGHKINLGFDEAHSGDKGWYVFGFLYCEGCR